MSKKVSDLNAITTLVDTDLVLISKTGVSSNKIEVSDFHNSILNPVVTELSNAVANIVTDCTTGDIFKVYLNKNMPMDNPTGGVNGKGYTWWIYQDNAEREVTLASKFVIPSSGTDPLAWSNGAATANAMDMLSVRYDSTADKYLIVAFVPGY